MDKITSKMRLAALALALAAIALAQPPVHLDYKCGDPEIQFFGLTCSTDEPCPVYLELTGLEPLGAKLLVTGNFHTEQVTLDSVLLMSTDEGHTWSEPYPRERSASLEQIQFVDMEKGWASGETVQSLPRDPFFLTTVDGGKTWQKRPVFEEDRVASISQFWFDSPTTARLIIQAGSKYETYETRTGGSTWTMESVMDKPVVLAKGKGNPDWRLRADASSHSFRVERRDGAKWVTVASFPIHVADCKPDDTPPVSLTAAPDTTENPPPPDANRTAPNAPRPPRNPPTLRKPGEQP